MKFSRHWIVRLVFAGLVSISIMLFLSWREGSFVKLHGQLLLSAAPDKKWPLAIHLDSKKVITIPLNGQFVSKVYFEDSRYDELRLSYRTDSEDIYSARNIAGNYYTVLLMHNQQVDELMRSEVPIFFPYIQKNKERIVFISPNNKKEREYYLVEYHLLNKTVSRITPLPVVWWSRPMFAPDGRIIFAAMGQYEESAGIVYLKHATIIEIRNNGEFHKIVSGVYPTWFEEGKRFFYYDLLSRQLKLYDLDSKKEKSIITARITTHPTLSPDKKYLAFHEYAAYGGGDSAGNILQIMSAGGWVKRPIMRAGSFVPNTDGLGNIWWSE